MNKNIIILFFNLFIFFAGEVAFSQPAKFQLEGYIKGVKNGKIVLRERLKNQNIKCIQSEILILNGKFKFQGEISDPTEARFVINDTLFSSLFFLEFGKHQTILNIDSISNPLIIKGSKSNNEYLTTYLPKMESFENKIQNWYTDKWALEKTFNQKLPASINDSMEIILKDINYQKDSALLAYIKRYPASQVAVWNLYYRVYGQGYLSVYDSTFNLIDRQLKRSNTGTGLKKLLDEGRQTVIGVIFPSINAINSFGNLKNIFTKGLDKFTLIDLWFSGCLPCIRQFEELKSIYLKYVSKGFKIIGVSIDNKENEIQWRNAVSKNGLLWPQYWDIGGEKVYRLSINTFPSNFLLDREGKIIAKNIEPSLVAKFLRENL